MKIIVTLVLASLALPVSALDSHLGTDKEKLSYSLGVNVGERLLEQAMEIESASFALGVEDAIAKKNSRLPKEAMQKILTDFQQQQMAKLQTQQKQVAEKNLQSSLSFLDTNKKDKTVKTLPSGLQYQVLNDGKGKSPDTNDFVSVHYRGTLIDGTEFDSSYTRGSPATFNVQAVIPGWTEALQMMKPGAKWRLYVPPALAYGEQGAGRLIGPNSALIFDVELLDITKKEKDLAKKTVATAKTANTTKAAN